MIGSLWLGHAIAALMEKMEELKWHGRDGIDLELSSLWCTHFAMHLCVAVACYWNRSTYMISKSI